MNIRDWPIDRIMQLPDNCFGTRFLVSCTADGGDENHGWDISEIALPERCVVWEMQWFFDTIRYQVDFFRIVLGDILPASAAEVDALEPLFPGLGIQGASPRLITCLGYAENGIKTLRFPVMSKGRRLIIEVRRDAVGGGRMTVVIVVSSIPTEVPDCLVSV